MADKAKVDPDDFVTFQRAADKFGVTAKTLQAWRRKSPDFPKPHPETKRYQWSKLEDWKEDHPDISEQKQPGQITGKRADLIMENLEKKNRLLDVQIAEKERKSVSVDRILSALAEERTVIQEAFRKRILSEIPAEADGRNAHEIARLLSKAYDEYIIDINDSIPRIIEASLV